MAIEPRFPIALTLPQMNDLITRLDASAASEADPNAEIFALLDQVRALRKQALTDRQARAMIHLVMAVVDYEGRDPVRAFTAPEEAQAFLAVVQAHQRTRPSVLTLADDQVDDWESLLREWEDKHPAPGHGSANRFEIETVPLGFE